MRLSSESVLTSACPVPGLKDKSMTEDELVALAREAALKAYAPYSRFHVGCAIESIDGEVVTGANMENACYRLGICAEQSALTAAQHMFGLDKVARIAVSGGGLEGGDSDRRLDLHAVRRMPSGDLRGRLLVRPRRRDHLLERGGRGVERHSIGALIPHGFGPANLGDAG